MPDTETVRISTEDAQRIHMLLADAHLRLTESDEDTMRRPAIEIALAAITTALAIA